MNNRITLPPRSAYICNVARYNWSKAGYILFNVQRATDCCCRLDRKFNSRKIICFGEQCASALWMLERKNRDTSIIPGFVIFTSCPDQTPFGIRVWYPLVPPKWIPILPRRAQKYTHAHVSPLVFSRWTYARGNEWGTRDSSGFRLSSITRLDVSLPY